MPDLKPCPFCGSTKLKLERKSSRCGFNGLDERVDRHTFSVRCNICHARGVTVSGKVIYRVMRWNIENLKLPDWATTDDVLEEKAIEAWNRRAGENHKRGVQE